MKDQDEVIDLEGCDQQRLTQLQTKLAEYEARKADPNRSDKVGAFHKAFVLGAVLARSRVNVEALRAECATQPFFNEQKFYAAVGVIGDYVLTGGAHTKRGLRF